MEFIYNLIAVVWQNNLISKVSLDLVWRSEWFALRLFCYTKMCYLKKKSISKNDVLRRHYVLQCKTKSLQVTTFSPSIPGDMVVTNWYKHKNIKMKYFFKWERCHLTHWICLFYYTNYELHSFTFSLAELNIACVYQPIY